MKNIFVIFLCLPVLVQAKFTNESEVNVIINGGNSDVETYTGKTKSKYQTESMYGLTFGGHYTYGTSVEIESARNWDINLKGEKDFKAGYSIFFGETVMGDKFKGIDQEYNTDIGGGYTLLKTQKNTTKSEAGYRYSVQRKIEGPTEQFNKLRLFLESKTKHTKSTSTRLAAEYLPNLDESEDWNLNVIAEVNTRLSDILSFKTIYDWKVDNLPVPGSGKYDYALSVALLMTFE